MIQVPKPAVLEEISRALEENEGVLGRVARVMSGGVTSPTVMAQMGAGANAGAAANLARVVRYVKEGVPPKAPSVAASTARSLGGVLRDNPGLSPEATSYLQALRDLADTVEKDDAAVIGEQARLKEASEELTVKVEKLGGVYVYTFPTYLKIPAKYDPERFWLKIGQTGRVVNKRVSEQLRSTAMPEDPVILRVYTDPNGEAVGSDVDYAALEKKFHKLLMSAGHSKTSAKSGGTEWFATTLDFLDEIAETLELAIETRDAE
jgi:hypothetical protein